VVVPFAFLLTGSDMSPVPLCVIDLISGVMYLLKLYRIISHFLLNDLVSVVVRLLKLVWI
jgi:hypothetical protein